MVVLGQKEALRLLNVAGSQASGADPNALCRAVEQRPNGLQVGPEDPLRFVIGVTDVISAHAFFSAHYTGKSHDGDSFPSNVKQRSVDTIPSIPLTTLS